jgi:N4-gp56 family major capsid protein
MATHNTVASQYCKTAIQAAFPINQWPGVFGRQKFEWATGVGHAGVFTVREHLTIKKTALPDAGAGTISQNPNLNQVSVTCQEIGEGSVNVNRAWEKAFSFDPELDRNIQAVAELAQDQCNLIIAKQGLDAIGGALNTSYVHGTGTYAPVAANLVYYGSDTVSDASFRAAITTSDTLTDVKWIRRACAILKTRGVKPIMWPDGAYLYAGFVSPQLANDLRAIALTAGGWYNFMYTDSSRMVAGVIGDFEGIRWIEDPLSIYPLGGASSVHVHPMTICGDMFLGIPRRTVSELPELSGSGAIINIDEYMQVRVVPGNDPHGRMSSVSPYQIMGAGVIDPRNGFRQEFYANDQSISAAQTLLAAERIL